MKVGLGGDFEHLEDPSFCISGRWCQFCVGTLSLRVCFADLFGVTVCAPLQSSFGLSKTLRRVTVVTGDRACVRIGFLPG